MKIIIIYATLSNRYVICVEKAIMTFICIVQLVHRHVILMGFNALSIFAVINTLCVTPGVQDSNSHPKAKSIRPKAKSFRRSLIGKCLTTYTMRRALLMPDSHLYQARVQPLRQLESFNHRPKRYMNVLVLYLLDRATNS